MSIDPITNGHLLVIPKNHQVNILDIDETFISHSFKLIREKLYPMLKEKLNCEGLTLLENNFLGQEIKHFHIHLIPRYQNDNAEMICNKECEEHYYFNFSMDYDSMVNVYDSIIEVIERHIKENRFNKEYLK